MGPDYIDQICRTHKLNEQGFEAVREFKLKMAEAMRSFKELQGSGNYSSFYQKMEEAMFFGTKAIAENPDNHTEIIRY